jgi:hypothetical protein
MGRRRHEPDPAQCRQVEAMAGYGVPEADIACVLEIDPKTLRRHYRRELDKGHIKASAKVAENLYRMATGEGREAVTAAIFWLKTRASWKETSIHELAGEVRYVARLPLPSASLEDWQRRYASGLVEHNPVPEPGPSSP